MNGRMFNGETMDLMEQAHPQNLNIFQRGILQKIASSAVYFASFIGMAFTLDWLEKRRFTVVAEKARQQGILTSENLREFKLQIAAMDINALCFIIIIGFLGGAIGWLLMRKAANLNWSWPTMLPEAVAFRSAMRMLNVADPAGEIECVRKHKLRVFIAFEPLLQHEQKMVRAQLYAVSNHMFSMNNVFERHIGKQTLCLDAAEYELLAEKIKKDEGVRESIAITAKSEEIKGLRASVASLTQENTDLAAENKKLRGKVDIQPAHEGGRVDRLREERLLWAAYTPVMERLMREAPDGKQYTTPEIEDAFKAEWERRVDLREHMLRLTESEEANPSESFLKAVKAEFKLVGKLSPGGRPRKNP